MPQREPIWEKLDSIYGYGGIEHDKMACSATIIITIFLALFVLFAAIVQDRKNETRKNIQTSQVIEEKIENVYAVYMHKLGEYSIAYSDSDNPVEFKMRNIPGGDWATCSHARPKIRILGDVPQTQKMWVNITGEVIPTNSWNCNIPNSHIKQPRLIEIHIHNPHDIQGGRWNRSVGKFGSIQGQTNIVAVVSE